MTRQEATQRVKHMLEVKKVLKERLEAQMLAMQNGGDIQLSL